VDYPAGAAVINGAPAIWSSQPGVERMFCPRCGSPIAYRDQDEPPLIAIHVGAFDSPRELVPYHATHEEEGFDWALDVLEVLVEKNSI
jgi:hypothetical protein